MSFELGWLFDTSVWLREDIVNLMYVKYDQARFLLLKKVGKY